MAKEVIWTESAWLDLEEIADYIANDSPNYSKVFVSEIEEAVNSLSVFPELGRIVPEYNEDHIRELFVRNYRLIYKNLSNEVNIISIIHGARDLWELI